MRLMQDWRVWMALLAVAALLLAGAVAFATGGFPGGDEQATLPTVVTARPLEPASAVATEPPSVAETSVASAAVSHAPAPVAPAPAPGTRPKPTPATKPAARPAAPSRVKPKREEPAREVVTPRLREEEESGDGHKDGHSSSDGTTMLRPMSTSDEGSGARPQRSLKDDARREGKRVRAEKHGDSAR